MNKAIATILNKVLGDFVENLNADQLNMGVLSGDIRLERLRLKAAIFEKIGVPFNLKYGYVGGVVVKIPWLKLGSEPLIIQINEVYALLTPKPLEEWDSEQFKGDYKEVMTADLENFELVNKNEFEPPDIGMAEKLVAKIIDNIQINIGKIYVRYEDFVNSTTPFCFSFVLQRAEVYTVDDNWEKNYVSSAEITKKKVEVEGVTFYLDYGEGYKIDNVDWADMMDWDPENPQDTFEAVADRESNSNFLEKHRNILLMLEFEVKVTMNKFSNFNAPELEAEVVFPDQGLGIVFEPPQVTHLLKLGEFFGLYDKFQQGIIAKMELQDFTEEEAEHYQQVYREFRADMLNEDDPEHGNDQTDQLEVGKQYNAIIVQRKAIIQQQKIQIKKEKLEEDIEILRSPQKKRTLLKKFSKEPEMPEEERNSLRIEKEQMLARLEQQEQDLKTDAAKAVQQFEDLAKPPDDWIKMRLQLSVPRITVQMLNPDTRQEIVRSMLKGLFVELMLRYDSMKAVVAMKEYKVKQYIIEDSPFPFIAKAGRLDVIFEHTPNSPMAQISLDCSGEGLQINVLLDVILNIAGIMERAILEQFDVDYYASEAASAAQVYAKAGEEQMNKIVEVAPRIYAKIHFNAPRIQVPLKTMDTAPCLYVDLGQVHIDTIMAQRALEQEPQDENIYDVFAIKLRGITACTKWPQGKSDRIRFLPNVEDLETEPIFELGLRLTFSQRVFHENKNFPLMKINAQIKKIFLHASDYQVFFLWKFQQTLEAELKDKLPSEEETKARAAKVKEDRESRRMESVSRGALDEPELENKQSIVSEAMSQSSPRKPEKLPSLKAETNPEDVALSVAEKIDVVFALVEINIEFFSYGQQLWKLGLDKLNAAVQLEMTPAPTINAQVDLESLGARIMSTLTKNQAILNFSLDNLNVVALKDAGLDARVSLGIKADYYNFIQACWEPLLEPWPLAVTAKQENEQKPMKARVKTESNLNLNVSYCMIIPINQILARVTHYSNSWDKLDLDNVDLPEDVKDKIDDLPGYKFKNRIDRHVDISLERSIKEDETHWQLKPGESDKLYEDKLQEAFPDSSRPIGSSTHGYLLFPATVSIKVEGFQEINGIVIEDIGSYTAKLTNPEESLHLLVYVYVKGHDRTISIESNYTAMNTSNYDVTLKCGDISTTIKPGKNKGLPFMFSQKEISVVTPTGEHPIKALPKTECIEIEPIVFLSLDYYELKCISLDDEAIPRRILQFNAPLVLSSMLPCPFQMIVMPEPGKTQKITLDTTYPGMDQPIYCINTTNNKRYWYCMIEVEEGKYMQTQPLTMNFKKPRRSRWLKAKEQEEFVYACNKIWMDQEVKNIFRLGSIDFELPQKYYSSVGSRSISVYASHWVVNKTKYNFLVGKKEKIVIGARKAGIFSKNSNIMRLQIYFGNGQTSSWSKKIEIANSGTSTNITIKTNAAGYPPEIALGISMVKAPDPCSLTTIVHIVPRHVIQNFTGLPILIKQVGDNRTVHSIPDGEGGSQIWDFENKKEQTIQIGTDESDFDKWSLPFQIEELDDFQVSFKASEAHVNWKREQTTKQSQSLLKRGTTTLLSSMKTALDTRSKSKWYEASNSNDWTNYIRIVIFTDDDATMYVNLLKPNTPDFQIRNTTLEEIKVNTKYQKHWKTVQPNELIPFIFNGANKHHRVSVAVGNHTNHYRFDKINKKQEKIGKYDVWVEVIENSTIRELVIGPTYERGNTAADALSAMMSVIKKDTKESLDAKVKIPGVFISIIDEEPKERLLVSIYKIDLLFQQDTTTKNEDIHTEQRIDLSIHHVQIDNMFARRSEYLVIFSPKKCLDRDLTADVEPFIKVKLIKSASGQVQEKNDKEVESSSIETFKDLQLHIGEMKLQLHKVTLLGILQLVNRIVSAFSGFKVERITEFKELTYICPLLSSDDPKPTFDPKNSSSKIYFEKVYFSPIKLRISFKMGKQEGSIQLNPAKGFGAFKLIFNVLGSLMDISDTPLKFKKQKLKNEFSTMEQLIGSVIMSYVKSGILQAYKIFGSIDLIGNPVSLVDTLWNGVWRFCDDPLKGWMKGGCGVCKGVCTGTCALLSNTVSGVFNSVGAITRAVYSIARNLGSFEAGEERLSRPGNICSGLIFYGLGGCIAEVVEGFGNCFSKPCKKTKRGGPGCCGRTLNGMLNLMCSPVTGSLRMVNQFSQGTANCFIKPAPENKRWRYPRQFGLKDELTEYEEGLAMGENCIHLDDKYQDEQIAYCEQANERSIVIITKKKDVLVYRYTKVQGIVKRVAALSTDTVNAFEVFEYEGKHSMNLVSDKGKKIALTNYDHTPLKSIRDAIEEQSEKPISTEKKIGKNPIAGKKCCQD